MNEAQRQTLILLYSACKEFVQKCDAGVANSRRSYRRMKQACEESERVHPWLKEIVVGEFI